MPTYEQRTIEHFFQEFGVTDPDAKARLLPLLTPVIYSFNQHVIEFEKEQDEYHKNQVERGISEIKDKIKHIIETDGKSSNGSLSVYN